MRLRALVIASLSLVILLVAFTSSSLAHAESVVWSSPVLPDLGYEDDDEGNWMRLRRTVASYTYGAQAYLLDAHGNIASPVSCGSSVAAGAKVAFKFKPHEDTDIVWFTTGWSTDSPYGLWNAGATHPPKECSGPVIFRTAKDNPMYVYLPTVPPAKNISGLSALSCSQFGTNAYDQQCTMPASGSVTAVFNFAPTVGRFYADEGYKGCVRYAGGDPLSTDDGEIYQLPVAAQTISCPITIIATPVDNQRPTTPSPTSGACTVGTPHTISMTATDPDGDTLRYGIDWNADGTINEWVPPSGYVASGVSQSASRTYSIAGEKTVKVFAQDEGGLASDWATLTFSCAETPPPAGQCSDNADNDSDGLIDSLDPDCTATAGLSEFPQEQQGSPPSPPLTGVDLNLRVLPSLTRPGGTTQVHWSATGFESCAVTAPNGDSWSSFASPVGGQTSGPIFGEITYTLSCVDSLGFDVTRTATVRTIPSWRER